MAGETPMPWRDKSAIRECPFCGEDGFDAYGLKLHLRSGWCEPFDEISEADRLPAQASTATLKREGQS